MFFSLDLVLHNFALGNYGVLTRINTLPAAAGWYGTQGRYSNHSVRLLETSRRSLTKKK